MNRISVHQVFRPSRRRLVAASAGGVCAGLLAKLGLKRAAPTKLVAVESSGPPAGLYVCYNKGNDLTGVRGDERKPFFTLAAAASAALPGDTIYIDPLPRYWWTPG